MVQAEVAGLKDKLAEIQTRLLNEQAQNDALRRQILRPGSNQRSAL